MINVERHIDCIRRIDELIRNRMADSPGKIAERLEVSERIVLRYIRYMKQLGAPIKFCRKRKMYLYEEAGRMEIEFRRI